MRHRGGLLMRPWPSTLLQLEFLVFFLWTSTVRKGDAVCVPATGCDTAYAFYRVQREEDMSVIWWSFQTTEEKIHETNPAIDLELHFILPGQQLFIPFSCDCINDQLRHYFQYQFAADDSLSSISTNVYGNLTQPSWVASSNSLSSNVPSLGMFLVVPVNCSCGNPDVSSEYDLFVTYPVVAGTGGNISGIATEFNTTTDLLKKFNKNVIWDNSQPTQYAFIPVTGDLNRTYPPYKGDASSAGKSSKLGVIVGAAVGAIVFITIVALVL